MKIALNSTGFRPGRIGGMETYYRSLVATLQEVDRANDYVLLRDRRHRHELAVTAGNFEARDCNFAPPSPGWLLRGATRHLLKVDLLASRLKGLRADVIHHPFSILNPLHLRQPSVLTFHDMQHEFFPQYFSAFDLKVRSEFYRTSAEQATRIIAISSFSKACLVDRYGVDPAKVDVVPNGCSAAFRVLDDPTKLDEVRTRYGLDAPFLYYPAGTWPHKNHATLLRALRLLVDRHGFDGKLVLTGVAMRGHGGVLGAIAELGLESAVQVLGYVPYADLPALYNLARALVFPSLFEGFGIPLLEAMASGCPVACSGLTSIPEVVGDAGLTFDATAPEDVAEKVWRLWTDEPLRARLTAAGLERVKSFAWEDVARRTVEVYGKACRG